MYPNGNNYLWNVNPDIIRNVININLNGTIISCKNAIEYFARMNNIDPKMLTLDQNKDKTTNETLNDFKLSKLHIFNMGLSNI